MKLKMCLISNKVIDIVENIFKKKMVGLKQIMGKADKEVNESLVPHIAWQI